MSDGVVVTGYGATTPLGGDAASTWEALLAGRSGVGTTKAEWTENFDLPVHILVVHAVVDTDPVSRATAIALYFALVISWFAANWYFVRRG